MNHILSILKKEGLECLPCDRINLDIERFSEYRDSNEHPAEILFERPPLANGKTQVTEIDRRIPTILHYFLDGSRRIYKISDVIKDGRYLPLIAGQIGVAVVKRLEGKQGVEPLREFCHFKNVITFPDVITESDLDYLQDKIAIIT